MDNIFSPVMSWVSRSITFAVSLFERFLVGKFLGLFLAMFTIYLVGKFLIIPFIGGKAISTGSDKAKHSAGIKKLHGGSKGRHSE